MEYIDIDISGKNVIIVGASMAVGKAAAMLLLNKDATVTVCHSKTKNLPNICNNADILIIAIGKANFITNEYVKEGAIVIDVGINLTESGDVIFEEAESKVSYTTPVPGGVGAVTNAVLADHIIQVATKAIGALAK